MILYAMAFFLLIPTISYSQDFSFLGLEIGMTKDQILETIKGSRDLIPAEDELLLQLKPATPYTLVLKANNSNNNMIQKVFVDFYQEQSYQLTIFLTPEYFSFYTLSEKLLDKYGTPKDRTSYRVTWFDNEEVMRLTLEYPSTIKMTAIPTLTEVLTRQGQILEQGSSESLEYKERQRILDEL